jgi:hypothetical protein
MLKSSWQPSSVIGRRPSPRNKSDAQVAWAKVIGNGETRRRFAAQVF